MNKGIFATKLLYSVVTFAAVVVVALLLLLLRKRYTPDSAQIVARMPLILLNVAKDLY